jgi:hypothetical protein
LDGNNSIERKERNGVDEDENTVSRTETRDTVGRRKRQGRGREREQEEW